MKKDEEEGIQVQMEEERKKETETKTESRRKEDERKKAEEKDRSTPQGALQCTSVSMWVVQKLFA